MASSLFSVPSCHLWLSAGLNHACLPVVPVSMTPRCSPLLPSLLLWFPSQLHGFFLLFQGATIKRHEVTGEIFIARVIHGGLAERSGEPSPPASCSPPPCLLLLTAGRSVAGLLHAGDRIIEVNGFSVGGMEPEQVIQVVVRAVRADENELTAAGWWLLPHRCSSSPTSRPGHRAASCSRWFPSARGRFTTR